MGMDLPDKRRFSPGFGCNSWLKINLDKPRFSQQIAVLARVAIASRFGIPE
jgi:hypothetical protein